MGDLVEKVARAICQARGTSPDTCIMGSGSPHSFECYRYAWQDYEEPSRAAIAVCMEEAAKVAREAALYSGCPADFIADEIADAIRALSQGEQG